MTTSTSASTSAPTTSPVNSLTDFSKVSGMVVFCQMAEPGRPFIQAGSSPKPAAWQCSVVLTDEDYVDELAAYGKSISTMLSIKKIKSVDFESTYHVAPPADAGKNVWVFTLRKSTELGGTGKPVPLQYQPKVFERKDRVLLEITTMKLIGNGSYGTMSIDRFDFSKGGSALYLKNLLVTHLVEYSKVDSSSVAGSEFDDVPSASTVPAPKAVRAPEPVRAAKPKAMPMDDLDDSDCPF